MSDFQPIVSSNIESAAYDAAAKTITVKFRNGTAYKYFNAGPHLWQDFAETFDGENGRSAGKFFFAKIKALDFESVEA